MEPRIQYAQTADGVGIAFWTLGEGKPLVPSHAQLAWQVPEVRRVYEGFAKAQEVLRTHNRIVRDALKAHGGFEVKTMGDGFMASFVSATRALECSIAMQRAFSEHNQSAEEPIRVRVGLNAVEPIAEDYLGLCAVLQIANP